MAQKKWREKALAMQGFTYSQRIVYGRWPELKRRANLTPEKAVAQAS